MPSTFRNSVGAKALAGITGLAAVTTLTLGVTAIAQSSTTSVTTRRPTPMEMYRSDYSQHELCRVASWVVEEGTERHVAGITLDSRWHTGDYDRAVNFFDKSKPSGGSEEDETQFLQACVGTVDVTIDETTLPDGYELASTRQYALTMSPDLYVDNRFEAKFVIRRTAEAADDHGNDPGTEHTVPATGAGPLDDDPAEAGAGAGDTTDSSEAAQPPHTIRVRVELDDGESLPQPMPGVGVSRFTDCPTELDDTHCGRRAATTRSDGRAEFRAAAIGISTTVEVVGLGAEYEVVGGPSFEIPHGGMAGGETFDVSFLVRPRGADDDGQDHRDPSNRVGVDDADDDVDPGFGGWNDDDWRNTGGGEATGGSDGVTPPQSNDSEGLVPECVDRIDAGESVPTSTVPATPAEQEPVPTVEQPAGKVEVVPGERVGRDASAPESDSRSGS